MKIHWTHHATTRLTERQMDKDVVEASIRDKARGLKAMAEGSKCRVFGKWGKAVLQRVEDGILVVTVFRTL